LCFMKTVENRLSDPDREKLSRIKIPAFHGNIGKHYCTFCTNVPFYTDNPNISARELAEIVGITSRKIEENIKKLKNMGLLKRIGPAKGGYWEIIE